MTLSARPFRSRRFVACAVLTLLTFTLEACVVTRAAALTELQADVTEGTSPRLWLQKPGARSWLVYSVTGVEYPTVIARFEGWARKPGGSVRATLGKADPADDPEHFVSRSERLSLTDYQSARVYSPGGALLTSLGLVVALGIPTALLLIMIIVALTKTSCPFVYVEGANGELVFAGETYSGSTGFATARDDLLPLPPLAEGPRRLVLANEAHETQYTDRLQLWLVEHGPETHALSSFDGRVLLAGAATPPLRAVDLDGRDVLPLVRDADDMEWATDLDAAAERRPEVLREGVELRFPAPTAGVPPVLELDVGNTPWLDIVFGRAFAVAGGHLAELQKESDDPANAPAQREWRKREGVDLRVEVRLGETWAQVAMVPTPGPASRRRLAVPLPVSQEHEVTVRVSGGVGFWRLDRAALSTLADAAPKVTSLAPTLARQPDGTDARPLLAATDRRPQMLQDNGDRLELRFQVPAAAEGRQQEAFLSTHGWYHVHQPPQSRADLGRGRALMDDEGALCRFGLELWRDYQRALTAGTRP